MDNWVISAAAAVLILGGLAGCSSSAPTPPPQAGTVPEGTAQVTINNTDLGMTETVTCSTAGALTTITTGDAAAGTTSVIDNADALTAKSVSIHNLGGFTGSYWENLGGEAKLHMTGRTYLIKGTAAGFNTENPSARSTGTFTIRVSC
jgi:ipoprotein LpqH